jgi:hypothetical protein
LVSLLVLGLLGYLLNGIIGQLQVIMEIHKLGHGLTPSCIDALTWRWSLELRIEENYTFCTAAAPRTQHRPFPARLQ